MPHLPSFPHVSKSEFGGACGNLAARYAGQGGLQTDWTSVDVVQHDGDSYLKIEKDLHLEDHDTTGGRLDVEVDEDELREDDQEALIPPPFLKATIEFDIMLSPIYQVPVLYFSIRDPRCRHPPTMATLYHNIIHPQLKAQAENVGVIGGISITDHPATNSPVFFIHPCQTAAVLEASVGAKDITPIEYLMLFIGAIGSYVGLIVPLRIVQDNVRA
ncbi:hypothetical protein BDV95DRAFT_560838 [Massariosphaeria phaeospora]|uniref:Ubiquitin-like-conjugating enzyme ATG10 n=1 Tax=Massariosphaeria phaeospora TaxID=100035 RepID=A0A7C8IKH4_9PLEO|nr:hypothetical protein BDV95DRAFT_560838 [Massariosphaeria phaeospora]